MNVPTLAASHDSSPICRRTVGSVPNMASVLICDVARIVKIYSHTPPRYISHIFSGGIATTSVSCEAKSVSANLLVRVA